MEGDLISWGEPILWNGWTIWFPNLYFNYKFLKKPISATLLRFKCILHGLAVFSSVFLNFLKLYRESTSILGGNQFCKMADLFEAS